MPSAPDPLFRHDQEGSDAVGPWFMRAEIVHGRVHHAAYRDKRWSRPLRMSVDEFETFCRRGLEIVANARLAKRNAA